MKVYWAKRKKTATSPHLQRYASELAANPSAWTPWNFLEQTQPGHNQ